MRFEIRYFYLEVGLSPTEGGGQKSVNRKILLFGIFLFNDFGPPPPAELNIICRSDKFVGTANGKPPFGVPTIFVGTIVPTNLSEQPIGIQFPVPTILVETVLFPQSL